MIKPNTLALALSAALFLSSTALTVATGQESAKTFDPNQPVTAPAESLEFQPTNAGVKRVVVWGAIASGPFGAINEFPPHFIAPVHTHSHPYHGIVLSGTMINPFGNDPNPPKMGPGSHWYVPAEAVHTTGCVSDTPCRFYYHSEMGFDFKPVAK